MLAVTVELLHGTLRAGSPDDLVLTGREDPGEWPPSPARMFAALVAADGTRERCRVTDGSELAVLEQAGPPVIVADDRDRVLVSGQVERFVVANERAKGATQEYVARKNTSVRPAPRLCPHSPVVTYLWPDLDVADSQLAGLQARAARIGYLGCADSPVRVRVQREAPSAVLGDSSLRWEPADDGTELLPVPYPGLVDVLDRMYDDFTRGVVTRRAWYRSERQRYRPPGQTGGDEPAARPVVWLRLGSPVTGRHILHVTEALRNATLGAYERQVAGSRNNVPAVLHAHGFEGSGYDHVSWLALPDVGHPHASGRIHGAAVVLPADVEAEVVEGTRSALWSVRRLLLPGGVEVAVAPHQGERRPWASNPRRWALAARRWVSAFPVVHERWSKRPPDLSEITRWCENAGIHVPVVRARLARPPLLAGGVTLMPHETTRRAEDRRPYSHLALEFGTPVTGPVVLGRQRHFGLGLMVPDDKARHAGAIPPDDGTTREYPT